MNDWHQIIAKTFEKYGIKTNCHGNFVELEMPDGKRVEFGREHAGVADWFVVKLNGERVHQG